MFWNIFYQLCVEKNTKPNAVAKVIGVSNSTCTKWKNGSIPNGEILLKLADYLGVSVDYLLGRTDNPNTESNVTLSSDQNRLLQMYNLLSDMEKGEILGELKAMTANKVT